MRMENKRSRTNCGKRLLTVIAFVIAAVITLSALSGCGEPANKTLSLRGQGLTAISEDIKLNGVSNLDLRDNRLTDLTPLYDCEALTQLDVRGNEISAEQYEKLREALPECNIVWSIKLGDEYYDSTTKRLELTVDDFSQIEGIKYMDKLSYCNLSGSELPSDKMYELHLLLPETHLIWDIALGDELIPSDTKSFRWRNKYGSDLSLLRHMYRLTSLDMSTCHDVDISPLKDIPTLTELTLSYSKITDFSPLSSMTGLKKLSVEFTGLDDMSIIAPLTQLMELNIGSIIKNKQIIKSLDEIKDLTELRSLSIMSAGLTDISAISNMTKLKWLALENNPIEDFSALEKLTGLVHLDLFNTGISDISVIANMTELNSLCLGDVDKALAAADYAPESVGPCEIVDYSPIGKLTKLRTLEITNSNLTDISFVSSLQNAGVFFLYHNRISDPTPLYSLQNLQDLDIHGNKLSAAAKKEVVEKLPNCNVQVEEPKLW